MVCYIYTCMREMIVRRCVQQFLMSDFVDIDIHVVDKRICRFVDVDINKEGRYAPEGFKNTNSYSLKD